MNLQNLACVHERERERESKHLHGFVKLLFSFILATTLFLTVHHSVYAATSYIDGALSGDCTGNYSVSSRNCTGSNGNAYITVSTGVGAASAGDTINIRAGTYAINGSVTVNFSSAATTTIQAYNSENVTLTNSSVSSSTFSLGASAKNITFKDLHFTGTPYQVITSWTNYSGNVWQASLSNNPNQIRFDAINGSLVGSIGAVVSANQYFWSSGIIYAYSVGDPATTYTSPGINLADNFNGMGIGNSSQSAAGNLITVDNCTFDNFSHSGVKGTWKWWIKNSKFNNIGTDGNDHDVYPAGIQTIGNEMIFEYNYFGYSPGAGIHLFTAPAYAIIRYNVFNGLSGANRGSYGVLVGGANNSIYNNTFYGYGSLGGIYLYRSGSQNNIIKNNIFSNNTVDFAIDIGSSSYPTNNTVANNYFGSSTKCTNCTDYTGSGGPNLSTLDDAPPNTYSSSPWTYFSYDFTVTGGGNVSFFNTCGGGASPTGGTWYLDDLSIVPIGGGAEKLTNGDMEGSFTSGVAAGWSALGGTTGTQETSTIHGGSNSQKLNQAGGCGSRFERSVTLTAGTYTLTGWAKRDSGTGVLPVYFPGGGGNTSFTIGTLGPSFSGTLPYSSATDLKIDPASTDFSLVTDTATNLGTSHQYGLNSSSTSWPLTTLNQNFYGSGWDMGAFVYNTHPASPVVSSVASNTNNLSSLITWVTDKNTTSQVEYGTSTAYGNTTTQSDSSSGVTSHSVNLADLIGCSTYHYRIRSVDGAQNETVGSDNLFNVTNGCPTPPVCSNTKPESAPWLYQATSNKNSATLKFTNWANSVDHFALEYGTSSNNYMYAVDNIIDSRGTNVYTVNSLNSNTTYYFRIRNGNGCAAGPWSNEMSTKTSGISLINNLNLPGSSLESIPVSTESQIDEKEGYFLNVTVKDTEGIPIGGVSVTIHSKIQTAVTDKDGVARFTNVESGEHKILITYNDYKGEKVVNLTADSGIKEFSINVTVQKQNVLFSPQAILIVGITILIIFLLIFKLIKANNKIKI